MTVLLAGAPVLAQTEAADTPASAPALASDEVRQSYLSQYIWFDENELAAARAHRWLPRPPAYRGIKRVPLDGADFYAAIGRDDLADQYRWQAAVRWTLMGAGAVFEVAGLVALAAGPALFAPRRMSTNPTFQERVLPLLLAEVGGAAAAAAGIALGVGGERLDSHPVDIAAARELVDEYNKRLMGELSLDE